MPVEAVARNEVVVGPLFDDVPVVENDDLVRVGDGPQAMCDDDHRLARAEGSDCSLDKRFVLRVERSRGFVKEDHGGISQEGARWRGAGAPLRRRRGCQRNRGKFKAQVLVFKDELQNALRNIEGVGQALGYVVDRSGDYEMCQMFSGVLSSQVERIVKAIPQSWREEGV